jgi:hypothetical protein
MESLIKENRVITYIVELPFKGSIQTRLINGLAEYSGEEVVKRYIDENGSQVAEYSYKNQLNFEEYNAKHNGKFTEATEEEIDTLFAEHRNSLISEFTEITEDRYFDMLECLPPKRWHTCEGVEIFYMCECYTDDLYTCCGGYKGKYFSALRPIREESKNLSNLIKEAFKKSI